MFLVKGLAIFIIRCYQALHLSFFRGCCRFHPTCSQYAIEAIETRGLGMGALLTAYRIVRCQPFCKGGWDPVPPAPAAWDPIPTSRASRSGHTSLSGESLEQK